MEIRTRNSVIFFVVLIAIIAGALVRSNISTSLDSFTYDEAYHIGAGVSYVKTGDFRLNPEHPPLTKLWTGAYLSLFEYNMSPFRKLTDKTDERAFVEEDVYNNNDPDLMQSRTRTAMFALNGLLLFIFALAVRRVFGEVIAIAAIGFLAIDPTVAAHLPIVMTDLPVSLTSATAVLLAIHAFRNWRTTDLILAGLALGLALTAKHSAVITLIAIGVLGAIMALIGNADSKSPGRVRRLGSLAVVILAAVILLWGSYLFRFGESPNTSDDQFNRPLVEKIGDVKSPLYKAGLGLMSDWHVVPRAYTWGLADTIRAGAEGRVSSMLAFGNLYYSKAPWFYFPGVVAAKLPLGLLLLTLIGVFLLVARRLPRDFDLPVAAMTGFAAIFLFFLIRGSSYGGIRHALPVFPLMAVLASLAIYSAVRSKSYLHRGGVAVALIAALVSAIPVMRPWEYFNEIAGGTSGGHRYFNDEGVDLSLRSNEAVRYYHEVLKPTGEIPYVFYLLPAIKDPSKSIDQVGSDPDRDRGKWEADTATGTFIVGANEISPALWWDKKPFRDVEPIARFGNLFVFRGTFDIRAMRAQSLDYLASFQIYGAEPNIEKAVEMLSAAVEIDPKAFFVALELGNQYLKLAKRDDALRAYQVAFDNCPKSDETRKLLERQIERLKLEPIDQIAPLRNPWVE